MEAVAGPAVRRSNWDTDSRWERGRPLVAREATPNTPVWGATLPAVRVVAGWVVVLLAVIGCGAGVEAAIGVARPGPSRQVQATVPIVFQVPDSTQDPPMALTGGVGDSVWYWDAQAQDPTLWRVSGVSHDERAYELGAGCCGAGLQGPAGLTVAAEGTVWGVLNDTLVELDPANGHAAFFHLTSPPLAAVDPALDAVVGDPADLVAVSPASDELVIGFGSGADIAVFRVRRGRPDAHPTLVVLPSGYFALDIGILADGTIGVGMERFGSVPKDEIELLDPGGGTTRVRVADAFGLVPDGSAFLVGDYRPSFVSEAGQVGPLPVRFELPSGQRWALSGNEGGPDRLTLLPGGYVARGTTVGSLDIASASRSRLLPMPLQRYPNLPVACSGCGPVAGSTTTSSSVPQPPWVLEHDPVRQVVADGAGDLWVLTGTPTANVAFAELTAAQLTASLG